MTKSIEWKELGFQYIDTGKFVKVEFKNGAWGKMETCTEPHLKLHVAATCLHYGQAAFEGLKAFCRKDGTIAMFRPEENARRLISSGERLVMQAPPVDLFIQVCKKVINLNRDYVPPYGTGASLYIRPLLIGSGPRVGVQPSDDYTFVVMVMPVGPYYKNGFFPVKAYVQEKYDRAAPKGVGHIKAAGNYAAGMMGDKDSKSKGYPICLYLDACTHTLLDEFGTSNFIGITRENHYVTPDSASILPSVTNKSFQVIAKDMGLPVDKRPILLTELDNFAEVGACGTAAVITPIYSVTHGEKTYTFGRENEAGKTLTKLYKEIQAIQYGETKDRHGWMMEVAAD